MLLINRQLESIIPIRRIATRNFPAYIYIYDKNFGACRLWSAVGPISINEDEIC